MNQRTLRTLVLALLLGLAPGCPAFAADPPRAKPFRYIIGHIPADPPRLRTMDTIALEAAAKGGDPAAALALARRLFDADPPRPDEARRWLRKAADAGLASAQYSAGYDARYFEAIGSKLAEDVETARDWYEKAAGQGHGYAAMELGELYIGGRLPRDYAKAARWYRVAAENRQRGALVELGNLYCWHDPDGGKPDTANPEMALEWFRKSAEAGDPAGQFAYAQALACGFGSKADAASATRWLSRSATAGYEKAVAMHGDLDALVRSGADVFQSSAATRPTPPPLRKSLPNLAELESRETELVIAANQQGSREARLWVGRLCELRGRSSAELSDGIGNYAMAESIVDPYGGKTDPVSEEARRGVLRILSRPDYKPTPGAATYVPPLNPGWAESGADRFDLARLWWNGSPSIPANRTNAVFWYLEAARAGNAPAMRRLAQLWREGVDGTPDEAEADRWDRRAKQAEAGNPAPPPP